jgi:hypothetical protein
MFQINGLQDMSITHIQNELLTDIKVEIFELEIV